MTFTLQDLFDRRGGPDRVLAFATGEDRRTTAEAAVAEAVREAEGFLGSPLPPDELVKDWLADASLYHLVKTGTRIPEKERLAYLTVIRRYEQVQARRFTLPSARSPEPAATTGPGVSSQPSPFASFWELEE